MGRNYYLSGHGVQPTPKMLALLRKLVELNGMAKVQHRIPRGFIIQSLSGHDNDCWFPTQVGRGLKHRGLIDEQGCITAAGLRSLKLNEHIFNAETAATTSPTAL